MKVLVALTVMSTVTKKPRKRKQRLFESITGLLYGYPSALKFEHLHSWMDPLAREGRLAFGMSV